MKKSKIIAIVLSISLLGCFSYPFINKRINNIQGLKQEAVINHNNSSQNQNEISSNTSLNKDKSNAKQESSISNVLTTNPESINNDNISSKNEYVKNSHAEQKKTEFKKVIVIDPGHANHSNLEKEPLSPDSKEMKIKDGGGADGISTKTPEYKINMDVSIKLKRLLEEKGYSVVMTKTDNSQSLGNVDRAKIGNDNNAALVIRIHADSSDNSGVKGASVLVPSYDNNCTKTIYNESKKYGSIVLKSLIDEVGMNNRGVMERNDMTGFNWSKVPVILVEMGFLSNPSEDKLLNSQDYQTKIATALSNGIEKCFK